MSQTLNQEVSVVQKPSYGPKIGSHLGKPIYQSIERNGQRYEYDRLAWCNDEGCPLDQLAANEVLFKPGLIYRRAG
ncbi:hypothetical protein [Thiohalophilus thiocyanatoxydans]|uniref:Uncharacterized protein n=1 Tax=Thiohalophilus thiocyanatoxydans TaxID=381308 RepID=A0A4R8ITN2_9GAMM|nr:hypothetical protein [Thiohalophilus thiocyanatoxydans]TDY02780.1 hypothetical protein EDC23_1161 [Thiohalophilus thiocyanatoxydans]